MTTALGTLLVVIGGALGATARWAMAEWWRLRRRRSERESLVLELVPWPTFAANTLATFLLGIFVAELGAATGGGPYLAFLLLATGISGGMSTLSTAALEIVELIRRGTAVTGVGYLLLSIGAGMGALWLGLVVAP